jgi:uncharacterized radical SAM superfamily protein
MENSSPPPLNEVFEVFNYALAKLRNCSITLGCARPHIYSEELEIAAMELGFSAIAYPHEKTIEYAKELGIKTFFFEECCSLSALQEEYCVCKASSQAASS